MQVKHRCSICNKIIKSTKATQLHVQRLHIHNEHPELAIKIMNTEVQIKTIKSKCDKEVNELKHQISHVNWFSLIK